MDIRAQKATKAGKSRKILFLINFLTLIIFSDLLVVDDISSSAGASTNPEITKKTSTPR